MTGSDRDRPVESDGPNGIGERVAAGRRRDAAAFAAFVVAGSVVPIPAGPSGAGTGGVVGAVTGSLPVGVGLTAPFHVLGYAVLAALIVRATERERRVVAVAIGAAAAAAFGFGVELVQAPIPWRSFAWSDAALNAAGAAAGAAGHALRRVRSGE